MIRFFALTLFILAFVINSGAQIASEGDGFAGPGQFITIFANLQTRDQLQRNLHLDKELVEKASGLAKEFRAAVGKLRSTRNSDQDSEDRLQKEFNGKIADLFLELLFRLLFFQLLHVSSSFFLRF